MSDASRDVHFRTSLTLIKKFAWRQQKISPSSLLIFWARLAFLTLYVSRKGWKQRENFGACRTPSLVTITSGSFPLIITGDFSVVALRHLKNSFRQFFLQRGTKKKEDLRFVHVCSISLYLYKTSSWPFPARKFYKSATYVASAVCFRLEIVVIDFPFKIVADPMHIWKCWQATSWENIGNCFVLVRIAVVDLL